MTGSSAANGMITASDVRSVLPTVRASPARSPSAARAESRGSTAVASETVTTACGTIRIRNALA